MTDRPRQLRFPYEPAADESLCGALAAACHDSRVRSVKQVLSSGGVRLSNPGLVQAATPPMLAAVASIMKTAAPQLSTNVYTLIKRSKLALADVVVPRNVIELRRRRIGPRALSEKPHHRAAWLNRLLPYCPESLELLVDSCSSCGPLYWRHARGIGHCDSCGEPIAPSPLEPLGAALADDYRQAASLMSHQEEVGAEAIRAFPSCIQNFSRTTLLETLLRAGIVFSGHRGGLAINRLAEQPPEVVTQVVCAGVRMLQHWPDSIRAEVNALTEAMANDVAAYDALRTDLRWLTGGTAEGVELFQIAFATLDGRTADVFATSEESYYTTTQVSQLLNLDSGELKRLRDAGAVRYKMLPSVVRARARYHPEDIDGLACLLADCLTASAAAAALDVPVYAIDQMAAAGQLQAIDDPRIRALWRSRFGAHSVNALRNNLCHRASRAGPLSRACRLERALAAFPGEKPWGAAINALLRNDFPYYLPDGDFAVRQIMVEPGFASALQRGPVFSTDRFESVTHIALRDVADILGSKFPEAIAAIHSAEIEIVRHGAGKGVCRESLRRLAAEIAFTREIAAHTGRHHRGIHCELTRRSIPRKYGAWCRRTLVELGLVSDCNPLDLPSAH